MFTEHPSDDKKRGVFGDIWHWIVGCGCGCLMVCGFGVVVALMFWYYSTPQEK